MRSKIWTAAVLMAGWIAALAVSWPGHLSYDSILQLHDGRTGFYHSWHPPVMAWLLGLGDSVLPGTGLFIVLDATFFFGALLSLLWIGPRVSWIAAVVAAGLILLPQCLLYEGIVWKDVLFANCAVAGFVCLVQAEARWEKVRARGVFLAAAFVLLVLAALTRQNGLIALGTGAFGLAAISWSKTGIRAALFYSSVALLGSLLLSSAAVFALDAHSDHGQGLTAQIKLLRLYDIVGAVAAEPNIALGELKTNAPTLERLIRTDGVRLYSPRRNDALVGPMQNALSNAEPNLMRAQWIDLIVHHPWLYLKVRSAEFGWVFFTPDIAACRPVFVGVEGPADEMADLGIAPRYSPRDLALQRYATGFMGTPFLSHAFFAALALAVLFVLLHRRSPGDLAMAAMLGAAFLFTASFFAISIACDYRYLYFLDLAALSGAFYLALDPAYLFQVVAMCSGSLWEFRSDARKS
jgi:intracellular septation protein A